ncbi:uncharacterized protein LOC134833898 isoform X2 [Culicoides brevitarsis]|uniref:uncharacterized protein LOC134833898 isoform X2 n=1 Tax=Culicoides brevitarsis TaxID=469753 RepID=UPI00307B882E
MNLWKKWVQRHNNCVCNDRNGVKSADNKTSLTKIIRRRRRQQIRKRLMQTFETGVVDTGKRKIPYSLEGLGKLYNDDVILQLVQQLTSLNNKEQQLPVSYRTKDKISEYQLQFREKSPRRLTTDDDTSFKQNEFPENGLNLTELNNNKPHAVNHNLCENGKVDDDVKGDEEEEMGSNVSRYSEKGLSGRRAHSSGNLFSGNSNANNTPSKKAQNKKFKKKNNVAADDLSDITSIASTTIAVPGGGGQQGGGNGYDNASFTDPCIVNDISLQQLYSPYNSSRTRQQKQTYHGSLPNHLDDADDDVVDGVIEQQRAFQNNNNKSCMVDGSRYGMNIDSPMIEQTSTDAYLMQYQNPNISQQKYQIQSSPYNGSNSTFRGSSQQDNQSNASTQQQQQQQHPMLHLPLINRNNDATYDPGYGSERSPEDEVPPLLPQMMQNLAITDETTTTLPSYLDYQQLHRYEFITKDSIFSVHIVKGPRGLGLSVSGGTDSTAPFPGLIRIKRLFPHQAAWSIGVLKQGDIILAVNGVQLTGLTNYEALEVLRTTPDEVFMIICRPSDERYRKLSPPAEPPMPPIRSHGVLDHFNNSFSGEFELILTKQQGSLGFTLRKEDENVLGHCVRALVREPALSDGRIKPGDKILAVNDIPISNMSHEQAVIFLRQAPDTVKLRLFRDDTLTPLSAVSPTEIERKALNMSSNSKKVVLRPEAINLLTDIAYRKQNSGGDDSTSSSVKSSSPSRRLKRAHKSPHSSTSGSQGSSSNTFMQQSGTESDTSTVVSHDTNNSCRVQQVSSHSSISYCNNGLISEPENEGEEEFYNEDELLSMVDDESYYGERPGRPNYLDLTQPGSTPTGLKKPQFSIAKANAYELNNLDNDVLDAPTIYTLNPSSEQIGDDFTSLPCETLLVECKNKKDLEYVSKFTRGHPMYQSQQSTTNENGSNGLLKWKGAMLAGDAEQDEREEMAKTPNSESICDVTVISQHELSRSSSNQSIIDSEGNQLITVELNRGWNSRLGFSVTKDGGHIYISAVYADSVAARDGRLRKNDRILTVNDESVDGKEKHEVIDLLRTIRGAIVITVARKFNANNNNGAPVHYDVGCETEGEN